MRYLAAIVGVLFLVAGLGTCATAKGAPIQAVASIWMLIGIVVLSVVVVCDYLKAIVGHVRRSGTEGVPVLSDAATADARRKLGY